MQYIYKISFPSHMSTQVYIGKSIEPEKRFKRHIRIAETGPINKRGEKNRDYKTIHKAIRKHKIENAIFEIISVCIGNDDENAYKAEKIHISQYDSFHNGYNETEGGRGTGSGVNSPFYQKKNPKVSAFQKGRKCSQQHIKNISLGKLGNKNPRSQIYRLTFNDGTIEETDELTQYCEREGYDRAAVGRVYYKKNKYHFDIIAVDMLNVITKQFENNNPENYFERKKQDKWKLTTKDKRIIFVHSLNEYAESMGHTSSGLSALYNKKVKSFKGLTLIEQWNKITEQYENNNVSKAVLFWEITKSDGSIITFNEIKKYADENRYNPNSISRLYHKKIEYYKDIEKVRKFNKLTNQFEECVPTII